MVHLSTDDDRHIIVSMLCYYLRLISLLQVPPSSVPVECQCLTAGETNGMHEAHMNGNGTAKQNGAGGDVSINVHNHGENEVQPDDDRGMVLPFSPITISFRDIHYFVPLPAVRCLHHQLSCLRCKAQCAQQLPNTLTGSPTSPEAPQCPQDVPRTSPWTPTYLVQ